MTDENEGALLARAKSGDTRAYSELIRSHQQRLFSCAVHMLASTAEADDAVQETFIRAWRAIAKFDERSALGTWLYRICVNVCLNAIRRRSRLRAKETDPRLPPVGSSGAGATPEEIATHNEIHAQLLRALDALSPSLRTTVILVLVQGLSHEETAAILGCPEGTVAWRVHEARRRLRSGMIERVDKDGPPPPRQANARRTP